VAERVIAQDERYKMVERLCFATEVKANGEVKDAKTDLPTQEKGQNP
jgi:hypothetical protein